jgi:hypothetical protein
VLGASTVLLLIQAAQSSVAGVVRDGPTGQPLAEAVVSLPDLNRSVLTDSTGRYQFVDVPAGPQHLSVRRIGYAPRTLHALVPGHGVLRIDASLEPVPLELPVLVVHSNIPLRGADSGTAGLELRRSVSAAELRNDPLLAEPDGLLGLTGGDISAAPESPSGLNIRGGASDHTRYLLDGIPVFSPYHTAGTFTAWNPDALDRLEVSSGTREGFPDALAGVVSAHTRNAGSLVQAQGAMSTTQARAVIDAPLGRRGGYLVSFRTGYPGLLAPGDDASYLRGETQDLLAKAEVPMSDGRLHLLVYDSRNVIGSTTLPDPAIAPARNGFEWNSRSIGAQFSRLLGSTTFRVLVWSASSDVDALWISGAPISLSSDREDYGVLAGFERAGAGWRTTYGIRMERSRTAYQTDSRGDSSVSYQLNGVTPAQSVFLQHEHTMSRALAGTIGVAATSAARGVHLDLESRITWRPAALVALSFGYGRSHQFSQSLRNTESVVGNIFPADLFIGVGAEDIPVARNQRGVIGADYRPVPSLHLGVQAYISRSDKLLLVAPRTTEPFTTAGYAVGSSTTPGFSLDASLSESRFGLVARYGWQRVRMSYADSSYTPLHGTGHLMELGAIWFPSTTASIRLAVTGASGRRATAVSGAFEWEACNLLDRGCEFGGSPQTSGTLGGTRLPSYLRLDLSLRKHWHLRLGRRDLTLGVFGTMSNLLGRSNILAWATDPATGRDIAIEMRPRAPLVAGLDWRF